MSDLQDSLDDVALAPRGEWMEGGFHSFPVNEQRHRALILKDIAKRKPDGPTDHARAYIGFAGFFNLDAIATGKFDMAVLCDANRHQAMLWRLVFELLERCPDTESFRKNFEGYMAGEYGIAVPRKDGNDPAFIRSRKALLFDKGEIDPKTVDDYFIDQEWIRNPDMYAHLHALAKQDRLAYATMNAFDPRHCKALQEWVSDQTLDGKPVKVDTVYASNIYDMVARNPDLEAIMLHFHLFTHIARQLEAQFDIDFKHPDSSENYRYAYRELCSQFMLQIAHSMGKTKDAHWQDAIIPEMEAITQAFLHAYGRYDAHTIFSETEPHSLAKIECYNSEPENPKVEMAQRVFQELVFTCNNEFNVLELLDVLHSSPSWKQKMYPELTPNKNPDYATIRSLSDHPDTVVYCTSVFERPLLTFHGPDSANKPWRDRMRAEGAEGVMDRAPSRAS
jgi:hypothetical protein